MIGKCVDISPMLINSYLKLSVPARYVVILLSTEQLASELSDGVVRVWPTDGQFPIMKLNVKYVILHKIGIMNWYLSTHIAIIYTSLAQLIYQIGTGTLIHAGYLIFQQILRHVNTYDINISICFPQILIGFLLAQHPNIITDDEVAGPAPRIIVLSYKLFQGSHVSDLPTTF